MVMAAVRVFFHDQHDRSSLYLIWGLFLSNTSLAIFFASNCEFFNINVNIFARKFHMLLNEHINE